MIKTRVSTMTGKRGTFAWRFGSYAAAVMLLTACEQKQQGASTPDVTTGNPATPTETTSGSVAASPTPSEAAQAATPAGEGESGATASSPALTAEDVKKGLDALEVSTGEGKDLEDFKQALHGFRDTARNYVTALPGDQQSDKLPILQGFDSLATTLDAGQPVTTSPVELVKEIRTETESKLLSR